MQASGQGIPAQGPKRDGLKGERSGSRGENALSGLSPQAVPHLPLPRAFHHHASHTPSLPRPVENKGAFLQRQGTGKKHNLSSEPTI